MDPAIRAQLRKVEVVGRSRDREGVPGAAAGDRDASAPPTGSEFTKQLDYPKGDPRNPLDRRGDRREVRGAGRAGAVARGAEEGEEAIWNLEKLESVSELMKLLKADGIG